jgi:HAMP domain-containing protein
MTQEDTGLTAAQTAQFLATLDALRNGDFSARLQLEDADGNSLNGSSAQGIAADAVMSVNTLADRVQNFALQASRLVHSTCVEGRLGEQMDDSAAAGDWQTLEENLNNMSLILAAQIRDIARVAEAAAEGDLSQKVTVAAQGEMAEIRDTFNAMVDQLQLLKDSVSRLMERVSTLNASAPGSESAPGTPATEQ